MPAVAIATYEQLPPVAAVLHARDGAAEQSGALAHSSVVGLVGGGEAEGLALQVGAVADELAEQGYCGVGHLGAGSDLGEPARQRYPVAGCQLLQALPAVEAVPEVLGGGAPHAAAGQAHLEHLLLSHGPDLVRAGFHDFALLVHGEEVGLLVYQVGDGYARAVGEIDEGIASDAFSQVGEHGPLVGPRLDRARELR